MTLFENFAEKYSIGSAARLALAISLALYVPVAHGQDSDADIAAEEKAAAVADAAATNAAFRQFDGTGLSPVTADEMADCAAIWDRWKFSIDSMNNPAFVAALDPALSSQKAKKFTAFWMKKAKAKYKKEEGNMRGFKEVSAKANEEADALYADWANNVETRKYRLLSSLGVCK